MSPFFGGLGLQAGQRLMKPPLGSGTGCPSSFFFGSVDVAEDNRAVLLAGPVQSGMVGETEVFAKPNDDRGGGAHVRRNRLSGADLTGYFGEGDG